MVNILSCSSLTAELRGGRTSKDLPYRIEIAVGMKYLLAYLLVKLTRTRATQLEGLDDCVIPIEPTSTTYRIKVQLHHMPSPIIDRKVIPYVIVDIATPPMGGLSLFNLYVVLSRSSGRATIRLLRNFDDKVFNKEHDWALIEESERLGEMDRQT